jgi:hypothetical protein
VEINRCFGRFLDAGVLSVDSVALGGNYQDREQIRFQDKVFDTFLDVD